MVISSVNHDSNYDSGLGARVAVIVKHNVYLGRQVIRTGILIEFQFWLPLLSLTLKIGEGGGAPYSKPDT